MRPPEARGLIESGQTVYKAFNGSPAAPALSLKPMCEMWILEGVRIRRPAVLGALILVVLASSCTREQQDKAQERAKQAEEEAKRAARDAKAAAESLAHKARQEAEKVRGDLSNAANDSSATADRSREKLETALGKAKETGREVKAKVQPAALETRVKTTLASALGLSTISEISVRAEGGVVTLSGTVATAEDKSRAERAALSVSGVQRIVNNLEIR
jgi:hyperosmotically inducible periplasmic protein